MKIIAFDPSLRQTGYAIVDFPSLDIVSGGIITTDPREEFPDRIYEIFTKAKELFTDFGNGLEHAVFEESFYNKNVKSANKLAQVRAVLIIAAKEAGCATELYAPNTIKKAVTGKGHASKQQVAFMVKKIYNIDTDIPDDLSDALAVAYTFNSRSSL